MLTHWLPPDYGGAGVQALHLARALSSRGMVVRMVASGKPGVPAGAVDGGVVIARITVRGTGRVSRIVFYVRLLRYLLLHARRYDLLHVHGVFWPATIAAIVARLYRKPLVLKMTRSGDDDPAALVSLRQQRGLLGWARFLPLKRANTVIALNQPMADDFLRVGLPQDRLRLWSNAVDTDEFRPPAPEERQTARAELSFRGREVLFPGGLLPHKGLATVIEACRDLLALFPELRLHVLGPCDPLDREVDADYVTHIRSLIDHDARVGSMVDFVGRVPSDRVRRYYWACDAFVLPSEREGQPNALLEAMACGVPCIASAIPGIEDMGLPEDLVAMISPGDHVALAQSLFRLLSTGQTLDLAQRRRALVVERFSMAGLAERYEELYRDLIDRYE